MGQSSLWQIRWCKIEAKDCHNYNLKDLSM